MPEAIAVSASWPSAATAASFCASVVVREILATTAPEDVLSRASLRQADGGQPRNCRRSSALYGQATTACLTAIVFMQVVNVHLGRSRRSSIVSRSFFDNSLITAGIVTEVGLILVIDHTAPGQAIFGTEPLGYQAWLVILPFATAMLVLGEVRKALPEPAPPPRAA